MMEVGTWCLVWTVCLELLGTGCVWAEARALSLFSKVQTTSNDEWEKEKRDKKHGEMGKW